MPRAYVLPQTATAIVAEPLAALGELDPRQHVLVDDEEWDNAVPLASQPAAALPLEAGITAYGNVEVVATAGVGEPAWLVLNDSYFPGWKAFLRPMGQPEAVEREVTIYPVNGNFRGVLLPAGDWEVRFRYSPMTFKLGGLTSAMAGIIILFAFGVWGWRRFYNPDVELTNTRSIAKNSVVPTVLNLFNKSIDFLFAAFYLRVLGPADAGSFATAVAVAMWYEILANFGLNTLIIREVSRDRGESSRYLLNTLILRLGTSAVATLPILAYLAAASRGANALSGDTVAAILYLVAGMLFSGAAELPVCSRYETARRRRRCHSDDHSQSCLRRHRLLSYGLWAWLPWSSSHHHARHPRRRRTAVIPHGPWQVDFGLQRRMVSQSAPLMINHLLAQIFFFIDVPLMQQINGEEAVGWYNSAYKWVTAINVIPSFFTMALFPVISRQIGDNLADARRSFRMAVKLMAFISLPTALVTTLLAYPLIGVLGGPEFLPHGAIALQIVIWSIPIGWINSVTNYTLIALGLERVQVRAFILGVLVNLVGEFAVVAALQLPCCRRHDHPF